MAEKRRVVVFIASSLDGYIATKDDSLDWLFNVEGDGDNGYSEFYATVDTVLMGKRTYDWIIQHVTEEFPYKEKECYVFTSSNQEHTEYTRFINEDIVDFTNKLKKQKGKNIWLVGGGEIIQSFIKEELVNEVILTVAPAVLGNGIPLFKEVQLELSLIGTRTFNQFVELHYEVKK
ncbi:dihydrofolate reductase family protein [Alkalihalobacterium bogoriense]|uniref:dihydrofolate reductase family protein n=1 Tax=Alkalihalobacterium bogoriense TaxID=246272 RepID=UPI00047B3E1F|nr:dihydrofolate reductase family protein [Alkalihalobacterium bogoriense]